MNNIHIPAGQAAGTGTGTRERHFPDHPTSRVRYIADAFKIPIFEIRPLRSGDPGSEIHTDQHTVKLIQFDGFHKESVHTRLPAGFPVVFG